MTRTIEAHICLKDEASKRFLSEAVKIIERWKMIED